MKKKTKNSIKKTLATTMAATMLLSGGLPTFAQTTEVTEDSLPTMPMLQPMPMLQVETPEYIDGEYIVTFKEGTTIEQMKETINKYGGKLIDGEYKTNIIGLKLTDKQYEQMKQDPLVDIIEQNQEVELSSYGQLKQYSHEKTNVPTAWENGLTGKGVKIAILDTGIFPHSDLNVAGGVSTVNYTNDYTDDNGHGTHVAGIIASKDNGIGTTGVASDATIYSVKVLNNRGKGDLMDIVEGFDWAIKKGVDIINVSLGTYADSPSLKAKVDEAVSKGIIVVAATGNSGTNNVMYPAKYDNVVAVGATDKNNNLASFSTYGSEVDVVAPGVGISSTYLNNIFAQGNGTSQAAPYVAGMLALYSQQYPDKSPNEITQMLFENTLDLGVPGKDDKFGHGLVQFPTLKEEQPIEEVEEPVQEEESKEEEPIKEEPKEETPVVEEEPTKEEPVVEEEPKQETPVDEEETTFELPEGITFDALTAKLTWEPFENANRYRISIEEKQDNGEFKSHRTQTVTKTEYDLSNARLANNEDYKVSIIPRVGFSYDESKAVDVYASTKNGKLVVSGQEDSANKETTTENVNEPTNETTNDVTNEKLELPKGITLDEEKENIVWEDFAGANRYRVQVETIDENGNLEQYRTPRTVSKAEFDLSYLRDKDNYKVSIIPRIGFSYEEDQAKEFLVSTKGEEVVLAGLSDSLEKVINKIDQNKSKTPKTTPTKENVAKDTNKLPYNIAYNSAKDVITWDKIDGTDRYRIELERKESNGQFVSYSFKRAILGTEFDVDRILPKGHEYKVMLVPRIGYKYDYDKAFEVYVSTKNGVTIKNID